MRKRFYDRADFTPDFHATTMSCCGIGMTDNVAVLKQRFRNFWNIGTTSFDEKAISQATLLNPTFVYTSAGDRFMVNVGTDPLANFHLSSAMLPIKGHSFRGLAEGRQFLAEAKAQFTAYCAALKKVFTSPGRVVIRIFYGDALALCEALKQAAFTQDRNPVCYSAHWSSSPLFLNSHDYSLNFSAPLHFNVIDTADLIEEVGLLNILLTAVPLLSKTPSATLYTTSLLTSPGPKSHFLRSLCGDVTTVTLLLNIIPVSYFSNLSTWCNTYEILSVNHLLTRFRDRIPWHLIVLEEPSELGSASMPRPLHFITDDLVEFLFAMYLRMFGTETPGSLLLEPNISESGDSRRHIQSAHYVAETFARFLAAVKARTQLVWMDVMKKFLKLVKTKSAFSLDFDHYEDLRAHLHRLNIVDLIEADGTNPASPHAIHTGIKLFHGWSYVQSLVCIILVVPRSKLRILDGFEMKELGKVALHCEVRGSSGVAHGFASLRTAFGELSNRGPSEHVDVSITDDALGLWGNEALVVSFDVPYYLLIDDPKELTVSLCARIVLPSSSGMEPQLGPMLQVFSASLSDSSHTCVAMNPPRISTAEDITPKSDPGSERTAQNSSPTTISLNILLQQPMGLSLRANVLGEEDKLALSSGAQVSTRRVSPTAVEVQFGAFSKMLIFPVPVIPNLKTRIARKSAYIEVSLILQTNTYFDHPQVITFVADRMTLRGSITCLFPISLRKHALDVTSMHRVNLDALPILDFSDSSSDIKWVATHASLPFSDQERKLRESHSKDVLLNLKDNLLSLMVTFVGAENVKKSVFGIHSSQGGIDTLLFVNQLRLDTSANSIVADVCILPMTKKLILLPVIQKYLSKITTENTLHAIHTADVTGEAWKQLLPVVVERCRSWSHTSNCEYSIRGRVPLTLLHSQIPICGCGQGLALGSFGDVEAWQGLEAFVTRAAIGLLFPSSFLDAMMTSPESGHT